MDVKRIFTALLSLFLLACAGSIQLASAQSNFVVHYRVESIKSDHIYDYYLQLLDEAIKATEEEFGAYTLVPVFDMSWERAKQTARKNSIDNLLIGTSYSSALEKELSYIPYPIDLGMMSYRVCFSSIALLPDLAKVEDLESLRRYSVGQGKNWLDVQVLEANGFTVVEHSAYESLFRSVARGRFDLFCRSINEILPEYEARKHIKNLEVEKSFAIYYTFPRFLWTNKSNVELQERVSKGMALVLQRGVARELWLQHNQESLNFADLKSRRIFKLSNPLLKDIDVSFEQYFLNPFDGSLYHSK